MNEVDLVGFDEEEYKKQQNLHKPKHSLWHFYDKDDELLYVSQKPNPVILMKRHWWFDTTHIKIKHFTSLDALAEAKATAIYNDDPKWNSHGRRTEV